MNARLRAVLMRRRALRMQLEVGEFDRQRGLWRQSRLRRLLVLRFLYRHELERPPIWRRQRRRWQIRPLFAARERLRAWFALMPLMRDHDPDKFFNYMRLPVAAFDELLALLHPHLERRPVARHVSAGERLAVTLRYLAAVASMVDISYAFLLPATTVTLLMRDTCQVIWDVLQGDVFPQLSPETWQQLSLSFLQKWQYPNCAGALDGKHCVVQNFPHAGSDFFNYKVTFSLVLLALCDASYKFTAVDIGGRGRRSDGGLFRRWVVGQRLRRGTLGLPPPAPRPGCTMPVPTVFVGDEAFGLTPNLMTPFGGQFLPDEKNIFNYRLSRARRVVENAFGIMTARFRLLRRSFIASRATAQAAIQAVVCLHNWLLMRDEADDPERRFYLPHGYDDREVDGRVVHGAWRAEFERANRGRPCLFVDLPQDRTMEQVRDAGAAVREEFVDYFLGPGQIASQWRHLRRQ